MRGCGSWQASARDLAIGGCGVFLRRERNPDGGPRWLVNHKRVYRLYREEGLSMRCKKRKRFRAEARVPLACRLGPTTCGPWTTHMIS